MLSIYEHTIDLDKTKKKKVECEAYCINSLELAVSHCLFCSVQRDQDPYVIAHKKKSRWYGISFTELGDGKHWREQYLWHIVLWVN